MDTVEQLYAAFALVASTHNVNRGTMLLACRTHP